MRTLRPMAVPLPGSMENNASLTHSPAPTSNEPASTSNPSCMRSVVRRKTHLASAARVAVVTPPGADGELAAELRGSPCARAVPAWRQQDVVATELPVTREPLACLVIGYRAAATLLSLARRSEFLRFVADDPAERAAAFDQFRARIPAGQIFE